jgi:dsRNA-specific ribonuclease
MGTLARDTEASAEKAQIEILKALPAWRKLELLGDACETNRALMLAGLRSRYPSASEDERRRMLMGLMVGEKAAAKIWDRRSAARR